MNILKLNSTELEITSFNKVTNFSEDTLNSTASCNLADSVDTDDIAELASSIVTSLEIYCDETKIYELTNIRAQITNLNEVLNGDSIVRTVNLAFI